MWWTRDVPGLENHIFFLQNHDLNVTWVLCSLSVRFMKRLVSNQRGIIVFVHVFANPYARGGEYSEERFVDSIESKKRGRKGKGYSRAFQVACRMISLEVEEGKITYFHWIHRVARINPKSCPGTFSRKAKAPQIVPPFYSKQWPPTFTLSKLHPNFIFGSFKAALEHFWKLWSKWNIVDSIRYV